MASQDKARVVTVGTIKAECCRVNSQFRREFVLSAVDPIHVHAAARKRGADSDRSSRVSPYASASICICGTKNVGTVQTQLTIIPDLANSCENAEDGKSYPFFLRKDVQFHDGAEPTAVRAQTEASDVDCLWGAQLAQTGSTEPTAPQQETDRANRPQHSSLRV
jgi:hypothetical protein